MRRLPFSLLAILLLCSCVFAQSVTVSMNPALQPVPMEQRASMDEVRGLFDSLGSKQQMQQMVINMETQMMATVQQELKKQFPQITPRQLAEMQSWTTELMSSFDYDDMMNDMAKVYQAYLTRDEIVAIRAFYESPAGRSMITKMPAIVSEYMQTSLPKQMKKMEQSMQSLEERMKKEIAEQKSTTRK